MGKDNYLLVWTGSGSGSVDWKWKWKCGIRAKIVRHMKMCFKLLNLIFEYFSFEHKRMCSNTYTMNNGNEHNMNKTKQKDTNECVKTNKTNKQGHKRMCHRTTKTTQQTT